MYYVCVMVYTGMCMRAHKNDACMRFVCNEFFVGCSIVCNILVQFCVRERAWERMGVHGSEHGSEWGFHLTKVGTWHAMRVRTILSELSRALDAART